MIFRPLLVLVLMSALAACSDKKNVPSPSPSPAVTQVPVGSAAAAPAAQAASTAVTRYARKASLDCDDRSIVLEASCSPLNGPHIMACTSQSLTVVARPGGALMSAHQYKPQPGTDGDPPLVEEKIGSLSCIRSAKNVRYIVAAVSNGGSCEQCEWQEMYDWDGKLVASSLNRGKPDALLKELEGDTGQQSSHLIGKNELPDFYTAPASR